MLRETIQTFTITPGLPNYTAGGVPLPIRFVAQSVFGTPILVIGATIQIAVPTWIEDGIGPNQAIEAPNAVLTIVLMKSGDMIGRAPSLPGSGPGGRTPRGVPNLTLIGSYTDASDSLLRYVLFPTS